MIREQRRKEPPPKVIRFAESDPHQGPPYASVVSPELPERQAAPAWEFVLARAREPKAHWEEQAERAHSASRDARCEAELPRTAARARRVKAVAAPIRRFAALREDEG